LVIRSIRFVAVLVFLVVVWETIKFIAGDVWRYNKVFGSSVDILWRPPLHTQFASDLNMPHIWDVIAAIVGPAQRNAKDSLGQFLIGAGFSTWREAIVGFVAGTLLGLAFATVFVHSRLLERAFSPYVVASQTVPILALSPMIVFALGPTPVAIAVIATYLTFFPVTIAATLGLRSPDPRAIELMRSYAASPWTVFWKLRWPASLPYLFTALKIAAAASLVGAIIGEGSGSFPEGLGRAIINFNEQYITFPGKLWAAIFFSALVGIAFFLLVRAAEYLVLRDRRSARSS
jgi:NitT/TauT family transport system permease protein